MITTVSLLGYESGKKGRSRSERKDAVKLGLWSDYHSWFVEITKPAACRQRAYTPRNAMARLWRFHKKPDVMAVTPNRDFS